jgi:undecaprenyl-diphosphatase
MNQNILGSSTGSLFVTFLASFLIWFMFAGLIVLWFFHGKIKKEHVLEAVIASFIAWTVSEIIKNLFPTIRPFEISAAVPLTLTIPLDPAFPSSHASLAFALAGSIQRYDKKIGLIFILSAALVGIGRVLGNVHYSIDIIGGAALGLLSVYLINKTRLLKLLNRNRT